jgi:predicted Zn-dependent peptidase
VYPPNVTEDQVLAAYDATVNELATKGPSQQGLERVVTKMRSDLYAQLEIPITRASALSHAVLFTGSFEGVFSIPDELTKVTPEQVREFTAKYLVSTNRTIINRVPAPASPDAGKSGGAQ